MNCPALDSLIFSSILTLAVYELTECTAGTVKTPVHTIRINMRALFESAYSFLALYGVDALIGRQIEAASHGLLCMIAASFWLIVSQYLHLSETNRRKVFHS